MKRNTLIAVSLAALLLVAAGPALQDPPQDPVGTEEAPTEEGVVAETPVDGEEPGEEDSSEEITDGEESDKEIAEEAEASDILSSLVEKLKGLVSDNSVSVIAILFVVFVLRYIGFVAHGNQTKLAVILTAMATAGLDEATMQLPGIVALIDVVIRAFPSIFIAPIAHRVGTAAIQAVNARRAAPTPEPAPPA